MDANLLIMSTAGTACLGMVAFGLRAARREATVNRRVSALAHNSLTLAPPAARASAWIDTLLLCVGKDRDEVLQALRAADYYHSRAVTLFAAMRLSATLIAGLAVAALLAKLHRLHGIADCYPVAAAGLTFLCSKIVLRSRVTARSRRIRKELPFVLDITLLMLESGISLDQCFRHFATWDMEAVPHSKRVMEVLVSDLGKGMAYELALDRWADRMAVDGATELAALFRQTVLHGAELGPSLRAFMYEFADRRVSAAREVIGKKTTQMTIVMVVFLIPALMIIVGGPAVSAVIHTIGHLSK